MNPLISVNLDVSLPESLSTDSLSIAVLGPDADLRKAVVDALAGCHAGPVKDFPSYPQTVEEVPRLLGQSHDVIMIEWDSNPEYALQLVEAICANGRPTVMVYSQESDPDLNESDLPMRCMRAGAREFLGKPFGHDMIAEALVRAAARRPSTREPSQASGRVLVFCGAKGGAGVTAIACNFAMALVQESSQSTIFIDLDLPLGDAALNLGVTPPYSTIDALSNFHRLDSTFLQHLLVKLPSGLSVLAAPGTYSEYRASDEAIQKLLSVARHTFQNVVVDVGSKLDATGSPDTYKDATTIYMVTQAGVPELRNANRFISRYFHPGGPDLEVVLNRYDARSSKITEEDIKKALSRPAKWKIASDYISMRRMQDTATPVVASDSLVSRELSQMARAASGMPESTEKRKGFSLLGFTKGISTKISASEEGLSIRPNHMAAILDPNRVNESQDDNPTLNGDARRRGETPGSQDEPETRIYNGNTYIKGPEGHWQIREAQPAGSSDDIPVVTWPSPEPITYGTPLSDIQFNATASGEGRFAYVPTKGFILPAGSHTLWVTFTPQSDPTKATQASVSLGVTKATPALTWAVPDVITCGTPLDSHQLNAAASIPGTFEYSPAAGAILADGQHTLKVTFTPNDAANYVPGAAEIQLVVVKEKPVITWAAPAPLSYGTSLNADQLNACASIPGRFTYSPAQGTILATGRHKISVTFTPTDTAKYATVDAEIVISVTKASPAIFWQAPIAMSYGTPLGADQLNATASIPGSFDYKPAEGAMLAAGKHRVTVTFIPADMTNYKVATATAAFMVAKAMPVVTWSAPPDIPYGAPLTADQLNAQADISGTFSYDPGLGTILPEGAQTLRATFAPDDEIDFMPADITAALKITKALPVAITWPEPADITYGTPLSAAELNATSSFAGTFTYTPSLGTVLTAGKHSISVLFTPADSNFPVAESEISLIVKKAQPTVVWNAPQCITYGTSLSAAQLHAEASVPGHFVYSPCEGEILACGEHTVLVEFDPDDKANYTSAMSEVSLSVIHATPEIKWSEPAPFSYGRALGLSELGADASVPGCISYAPPEGTVLPVGTHRIFASLAPADAVNYRVARASVMLVVQELADFASIISSPIADEVEEPPTVQLSERIHPVIPIRSVETKAEAWKPFTARPLESMKRPAAQVIASLEASDRPSQTLTGRPLGNAGEAETRTYRGQIYKKGADGQWHLQQA